MTEDHLNYLISVGVLIPDGFDEHGVEFYALDQQECKRFDPELYKALSKLATSEIIELVESGKAVLTIDENFCVWYEMNE